MNALNDGSESVDQFLARIASVKEGRDQASEERTRRMEEDFLKSRRERQARRLERARSLSPSKTGSSAPTLVSTKPVGDTILNPPVNFTPQSSMLSRSNAVSSRTSPKLEARKTGPDTSAVQHDTALPSSVPAGLARNGTLSWQQRPARDGLSSRPRPMSTIDRVMPAPKAEQESVEDKPEQSKKEIAALLATRDPAWFRQTQERGLGSAAFRKNQVEDTITVEHSTRSQGLPGMAKGGTRSASITPQKAESKLSEQQISLNLPSDARPMREASPVPLTMSDSTKPELAPRQAINIEHQNEETSSRSRETGNLTARRSPSPTKGLGGFVESAMMKRSDSVSKRWSVQANAGLKRGDSIAGMRPLSGARSVHVSTLSRSSNRDGSPSPMPPSRPESREGFTTIESQSVAQGKETQGDKLPDGPQQSTTSADLSRPQTPPEDRLSRSPSKNLDSRRWSPTKSSWLESALLSKPESPRPLQVKDDVPAWKANLQRNKMSRDLSPEKSKPSVEPSPDKTTTLRNPKETVPVDQKPDLKHKDVSVISDQMSTDQAKVDNEVDNSVSAALHEVTAPNLSGKEHDPPAAKTPQKPSPKSLAPSPPKSSADDRTGKKPPPIVKPKPHTPPKTDFRSTLRSRAPTSVEDRDTEPEFKSVFGKLKRAQTQNYVAPDTLKDNILTGKAALNTTSGPQKTQRVDEFKESILQKKEAMKVSALQKKDNLAPEAQSPKTERMIPEALARRKTLQKATPSTTKVEIASVTSTPAIQDQAKPIIGVKPKLGSAQPAAKKPTAVPVPTPVPTPSVQSEPKEVVLVPGLSFQGVPAAQPDSVKTRTNASTQESLSTGSDGQAQEMTAAASPVLDSTAKAELPAGSKLASRLNPNLAAFLSRGGSPRPTTEQSSPLEESSTPSLKLTARDAAVAEDESGGRLTHMTKGRARGPNRRAPKTQTAQATLSTEPSALNIEPEAEVPLQHISNPTPGKSITFPVDSSVSRPKTPNPQSAPSARVVSNILTVKKASELSKTIPDLEPKLKPKPTVVAKTPELRKVSSTLSSHKTEETALKPLNARKFDIATDIDSTSLSGTQTLPPEPSKTPKSFSAGSPLTPSKSRINTPKSVQSTPDVPTKPGSPKPTNSPSLAVKPMATVSKSVTRASAAPDRPPKPSMAVVMKPSSDPSQDVAATISAYFPELFDKQQSADFDAQDLLLRAKESGERKIKTLANTIREVNGDGKKSAMPLQQEHILYEESMYLITHSFEKGAGIKSSEVYLWCGDGVADAAIEDAQLFCRKDARENNARLEVVKQGKEPARFFQALGGILIVRRSKSASLYMLRGRRHLGHIAFDEVDLLSSNLCSGFPHLVSAKFGKLYLWKGKGSGADEVGCARLIGMDIGLTGEIEEIEEGREPASFWDAFSEQRAKHDWSDDWQQRNEHNCYPTTLYRVELDRPKSAGGFWGLRAASPTKSSNKVAVEIINPFCERDLEPSNVYILDAYRSIYVILHHQAMGKLTEVVTALHLAQELAMLSPSVQDRSLLPSCYVAFGIPPHDVKACFRKWSANEVSSNPKIPSACIKLEYVMEALKL